jgi:hypothetical protein
VHERGRIDAEALLTEEWLGGEGWHGMAWQASTAGRRAYSGSARNLHEPFDFPVSAISLQLCSQQRAENHPSETSTPSAMNARVCKNAYLQFSCETMRLLKKSCIAPRLSSSGMTVSTAAETSPIHRDTTHIRPQHGKAVDTKSLALHGNEPSSRDDDSGLSDSNLSPSGDNDGYSSKDELGRSCTSKHSRWSGLDEQRLLAYKKEGKSWDWIFGKFPGRTRPAIRTRWNMVRPKDK